LSCKTEPPFLKKKKCPSLDLKERGFFVKGFMHENAMGSVVAKNKNSLSAPVLHLEAGKMRLKNGTET